MFVFGIESALFGCAAVLAELGDIGASGERFVTGTR